MKKISLLLLGVSFASLPLAATSFMAAGVAPAVAHAEAVGPLTRNKPTKATTLPGEISLDDSSDEEIRDYYAELTPMADSERTGTNLLKNLKPILQTMNYFTYDQVWKIYEITDREWELSPAESDAYGVFDSANNKYTVYEYGSNSASLNNPYVHTLYRNRDESGLTVAEGRIREWGDHTQSGGTNREHVWCQSRGFKAENGAEGPAGTDVHHLMSGDGYVNGKPHNNNPYGYVDKNHIEIDSKDQYAYCEGNYSGAALHKHPEDQSSVVFEPQDSDKGDIARACFYMVACYNNLSGSETITQFNPNLTLANYATSNGVSEDSSATHPVAMGILDDLLEWHKMDPVDEYEIHRNNLIYNNFQHNRNPFIDFPEWVDMIWGNEAGSKSANPATDVINQGLSKALKLSTTKIDVKPNEKASIKATTEDASPISWTISNEEIASISASVSESGASIEVTGLKKGTATLTATATVNGEKIAKTVNINVVEGQLTPIEWAKQNWPILLVAGIVLIIVIVLIVAVPSIRKKAKKEVKKAVKKQAKKSTSSSKAKKK